MRKIIFIGIFMMSIYGFSQEKSYTEKTIETKFDIRFNQLRAEIKTPLFGSDKIFSTLFIIRKDRYELFEGLVLSLAKGVTFTPSAGVEYLYKNKKINPRLRGSFRARIDRVYFKINYGSNWSSHDITTRIADDVIGERLQLGISSINQNVGPMVRMKMYFGKENKKFLQTFISYIHQEFRVSIKMNTKQWIKKYKSK